MGNRTCTRSACVLDRGSKGRAAEPKSYRSRCINVPQHEERYGLSSCMNALEIRLSHLNEPAAFCHAKDVLRVAGLAGITRRDVESFGNDGFDTNLRKLILTHVFADDRAIPNQFTAANSTKERRLVEEFMEAFYWCNALRPYSTNTTTEIDRFLEFVNDKNISQRVKMLVVFTFMADAMVSRDPVTDASLPQGHAMFPEHADWKKAVEQSAFFVRAVLVPFADRYGFTTAYRKLVGLTADYLYPAEYKNTQKEIETCQQTGAIQRTNMLVNQIIYRVTNRLGMELVGVSTQDDMDQLTERQLGVVSREQKSIGTLTDKVVRTEVSLSEVHDIVARFAIVQDEAIARRVASEIKQATLEVMKENGLLEPEINMQDYYEKPKPNGYRSIHLDIIVSNIIYHITNFELIIRTAEDHKDCDQGEAAHDKYKNGNGTTIDDDEMRGFESLITRIKQNNGWVRSRGGLLKPRSNSD